MNEPEEVGREAGGWGLAALGAVVVFLGIILTLTGVGVAFGPPIALGGIVLVWLGRKAFTR